MKKVSKKVSNIQADPDGLGQYDLSAGVRGKYAHRVGRQGQVIVHGKPSNNEVVHKEPITEAVESKPTSE